MSVGVVMAAPCLFALVACGGGGDATPQPTVDTPIAAAPHARLIAAQSADARFAYDDMLSDAIFAAPGSPPVPAPARKRPMIPDDDGPDPPQFVPFCGATYSVASSAGSTTTTFDGAGGDEQASVGDSARHAARGRAAQPGAAPTIQPSSGSTRCGRP